MLFCFLLVMRFQLGFSSPRGTVGCATFPFRDGFRLFVSPSATMAVRGRVSTLASLVKSLHFPSIVFLRLSPPATLAVRGRVLTVVLLYLSACVFLQLLSFAFFLAP